jgi:hypothetical protein
MFGHSKDIFKTIVRAPEVIYAIYILKFFKHNLEPYKYVP